MALTMTRTRTQTALNELASRLAEVNGELQFLDGLAGLREEHQVLASARREELRSLRAAFLIVIKRYDETLEPADIGATFGWLKAYGRKVTPRTRRKYFAALADTRETFACAGDSGETAEQLC